MKIRKWILLMLAFCLLVTLTACGKDKKANGGDKASPDGNAYGNVSTDTASKPEQVSNFDTSLIGKTFASGDYEYTVQPDGTVFITAYIGNETDLSIPTQLDGYDVTGIGQAVFKDKNIVTLTIPGQIREIGSWAFEDCHNLEQVIIQDGVEKIGYCAFAYCENLYSLVLPDTLIQLGEYAFASSEYHKLGDITCHAPNRYITQVINGYIYAGKYVLSLAPDYDGERSFAEGTLGIADGAFSMGRFTNDGLVVIPDGVRFIGDAAFAEHTIPAFKIPPSVIYIGNYAIHYEKVNGSYRPYSSYRCKIYGAAGSVAEQYAANNGLEFVITKD